MSLSSSRRPLVVTDLDGTLLDEDTYSFEAAREALDALRARAIPLVLATSKTQAEVCDLVQELGIQPAVIVENGGAVVVPAARLSHVPTGARQEAGTIVIELGLARCELVRHLHDIAAEVRSNLRGFASLTTEEVAALTGLPEPKARHACERRFDEPFLMPDDAMVSPVTDAARRRGLQVTRGGRFHHLIGGGVDKGRALGHLLALYEAQGDVFTTVGLGDAANDLPVLEMVDVAVIIPRPDGSADRRLAAALPHAARAPWPGPRGWNAAVLAILAGRPLPRMEEVQS